MYVYDRHMYFKPFRLLLELVLGGSWNGIIGQRLQLDNYMFK